VQQPPGAAAHTALQQPTRPAWDKVYFFKDPARLSLPDEPGFSVCTTQQRDTMRQRGYAQQCYINYAADIIELPPPVGPPIQVTVQTARASEPWDAPSFVVVLPPRASGFDGAGTAAEQHVRYFEQEVYDSGIKYAPMRLWTKGSRRGCTIDRSKFNKHCQVYCFLRRLGLPHAQVKEGVKRSFTIDQE
jgi:hypothetical protein